MGAWGEKPFQNDYVLNDLGYIGDTKVLIKAIKEALKSKGVYYYAGYEITALLCATFGTPKYVTYEEKARALAEMIKTHKLGEADLMTESSVTWMTACAIPLETRGKLLLASFNKLKKELNDPSTGEEYVDREKLINNMKAVYNDAANIINNKFANATLFKQADIKNLLDQKEDKDIIAQYDDNELKIYSYKKVNGSDDIEVEFEIEDTSGSTFSNHRIKHLKEAIKLIEAGKVQKPLDPRMLQLFGKYFNSTEKARSAKQEVLKIKCINKYYNGNKLIAYAIQDIT